MTEDNDIAKSCDNQDITAKQEDDTVTLVKKRKLSTGDYESMVSPSRNKLELCLEVHGFGSVNNEHKSVKPETFYETKTKGDLNDSGSKHKSFGAECKLISGYSIKPLTSTGNKLDIRNNHGILSSKSSKESDINEVSKPSQEVVYKPVIRNNGHEDPKPFQEVSEKPLIKNSNRRLPKSNDSDSASASIDEDMFLCATSDSESVSLQVLQKEIYSPSGKRKDISIREENSISDQEDITPANDMGHTEKEYIIEKMENPNSERREVVSKLNTLDGPHWYKWLESTNISNNEERKTSNDKVNAPKTKDKENMANENNKKEINSKLNNTASKIFVDNEKLLIKASTDKESLSCANDDIDSDQSCDITGSKNIESGTVNNTDDFKPKNNNLENVNVRDLVKEKSKTIIISETKDIVINSDSTCDIYDRDSLPKYNDDHTESVGCSSNISSISHSASADINNGDLNSKSDKYRKNDSGLKRTSEIINKNDTTHNISSNSSVKSNEESSSEEENFRSMFVKKRKKRKRKSGIDQGRDSFEDLSVLMCVEEDSEVKMGEENKNDQKSIECNEADKNSSKSPTPLSGSQLIESSSKLKMDIAKIKDYNQYHKANPNDDFMSMFGKKKRKKLLPVTGEVDQVQNVSGVCDSDSLHSQVEKINVFAGRLPDIIEKKAISVCDKMLRELPCIKEKRTDYDEEEIHKFQNAPKASETGSKIDNMGDNVVNNKRGAVEQEHVKNVASGFHKISQSAEICTLNNQESGSTGQVRIESVIESVDHCLLVNKGMSNLKTSQSELLIEPSKNCSFQNVKSTSNKALMCTDAIRNSISDVPEKSDTCNDFENMNRIEKVDVHIFKDNIVSRPIGDSSHISDIRDCYDIRKYFKSYKRGQVSPKLFESLQAFNNTKNTLKDPKNIVSNLKNFHTSGESVDHLNNKSEVNSIIILQKENITGQGTMLDKSPPKVTRVISDHIDEFKPSDPEKNSKVSDINKELCYATPVKTAEGKAQTLYGPVLVVNESQIPNISQNDALTSARKKAFESQVCVPVNEDNNNDHSESIIPSQDQMCILETEGSILINSPEKGEQKISLQQSFTMKQSDLESSVKNLKPFTPRKFKKRPFSYDSDDYLTRSFTCKDEKDHVKGTPIRRSRRLASKKMSIQSPIKSDSPRMSPRLLASKRKKSPCVCDIDGTTIVALKQQPRRRKIIDKNNVQKNEKQNKIYKITGAQKNEVDEAISPQRKKRDFRKTQTPQIKKTEISKKQSSYKKTKSEIVNLKPQSQLISDFVKMGTIKKLPKHVQEILPKTKKLTNKHVKSLFNVDNPRIVETIPDGLVNTGVDSKSEEKGVKETSEKCKLNLKRKSRRSSSESKKIDINKRQQMQACDLHNLSSLDKLSTSLYEGHRNAIRTRSKSLSMLDVGHLSLQYGKVDLAFDNGGCGDNCDNSLNITNTSSKVIEQGTKPVTNAKNHEMVRTELPLSNPRKGKYGTENSTNLLNGNSTTHAKCHLRVILPLLSSEKGKSGYENSKSEVIERVKENNIKYNLRETEVDVRVGNDDVFGNHSRYSKTYSKKK